MPSISPANPAPPPVQRGKFSLLLGLAALLLGGYAVWRIHQVELIQAQDDNISTRLANMQTQVEAAQRTLEQSRREDETLKSRLADHEAINKSLREEVIGAIDRTRMVEESVANLADKRLTGHDALLLNEAELLLLMGEQRYRLFQDPITAMKAYTLADDVLTEMDDSAFSTVRQSIAAEIEVLSTAKMVNVGATIDELDRLRTQLGELPVTAFAAPVVQQNSGDSRIWQVLGQFVHISHAQDAGNMLQIHDAALAETLIALDLREAQAALLARDAARYRKALAQARAQYAKRYDTAAPVVIAATAALDRLIAEPPAPAAPELLGASLKELRNLRVTHALRHTVPAPAKAVEPAP